MSPAATRPTSRLARSWAEHLRSGRHDPLGGLGRGRPAPRRTCRAAGPCPAPRSSSSSAGSRPVSRLARRDFARSPTSSCTGPAPGRGLAQQPLSWPVPRVRRRRFGAPPTDPSDVPVDELVRVAVGTLTELLLVAPVPAPPRRAAPCAGSPATPAFALAGAPVTTSVVRRELGAAGHAEGGRSPRVVAARRAARRGARAGLVGPVSSAAPRSAGPASSSAGPTAPRLPPSARLPGPGPAVGRRVGPGRVHVLVAPRDPRPRPRRLLGLDLRPRSAPRAAAPLEGPAPRRGSTSPAG